MRSMYGESESPAHCIGACHLAAEQGYKVFVIGKVGPADPSGLSVPWCVIELISFGHGRTSLAGCVLQEPATSNNVVPQDHQIPVTPSTFGDE